MSKGKRRVPKLRFPGFTEDWEQRKLSDLMEVTSVKRIHQADWTDSGVRFFRARDIVSSMNNEEIDNPVFISKDKYEEYSRVSGKVIEGDLLVTGVGTIGVPYLIKDTTPLYFKDGNIIWFKNNNTLNGSYFYYCFQNSYIQNQIYSASGKGTVGTYTIENGKKTSIRYPSLKEQIKIGNLLDTMTTMITLHQRKLDNLKLKKKTLLQKLFPKNGERYPELRFPEFTDAWEQREFSDIFAEVKSGLSRMLSNDDIGLPVVRANNINDGQLNLVDDIKYWYKNDPQGANTNNYLIEQGDILINFINSEAKMGTAAYVTRRPERDTIYTTNILRCKVNDEYNPYFIYSLTFLNSYKNYIASITKPAVNQASFTTVDFKKYSIKIPTVKEQNQIADLIETFNKLITLHQRKLDHLQLQKKALLQQMFV